MGEENSGPENIISQPAGLGSNLIWAAVPGACISMTLGGGEYNYRAIEKGRRGGTMTSLCCVQGGGGRVMSRESEDSPGRRE